MGTVKLNLNAYALIGLIMTLGIACSQSNQSESAPVVVANGPVVQADSFTGTFEDNTKGWQGVQIDRADNPAVVHSGKFGLVVRTGSTPYQGVLLGGDYHGADDRTVPVQPNTHYQASVWVKGLESYQGVPMQIQIWGSNGVNFHSSPDKPVLNGDWQQLVEDFTTQGDTTHIGVVIGKNNSPKSTVFAIDDFKIVAAE